MRKAVPVILVAATITTASAGFAWAATPGTSAQAASVTRKPVHVVTWIGEGSSEECGPSECGGGSVGQSFTMPGHGTYVASVTLSFQYRTRGTGDFSAGIDFGKRVTTLPRGRALAPATTPASATVVFRTHLVGGRNYVISPTIDVANSGQSYSINQRALLVEIDATPSHPRSKVVGPTQRTERTWTRR